MKLIYLANPYYHDNNGVVRERVDLAAKTTVLLMEMDEGNMVFSPVVHNYYLDQHTAAHKNDWSFWRDRDITILRKCDELCVLKLKGWEDSRGVAEEIRIAQEIGIPIDYMGVDFLEDS